jgi:methylphosphotriester-DNA--protein-cysteine methyltransferase
MIYHIDLGTDSFQRRKKLSALIASGKIKVGGNKKLRIYGTLECSSGKRMKIENRVFFRTEHEALEQGYRPCGHCMTEKYRQWKLAIG